jgi:hypothetical protein
MVREINGQFAAAVQEVDLHHCTSLQIAWHCGSGLVPRQKKADGPHESRLEAAPTRAPLKLMAESFTSNGKAKSPPLRSGHFFI